MKDFGKNLTPGTQEDLFLGVAIVVLETQAMQNIVLKAKNSSRILSFLSKIFCCCCGESAANFTFERAPEPSDVYWENLRITPTSRFFRVACTYFATFIIIGICFGIIWGINIANTDLSKRTDISPGAIKFLSFLCSFVIIITNTSLKTIVRVFSVRERQETLTAYNLSVAFKLALCRFINTAIVPTVVNSEFTRWFPDGGLVTDYFSIMISVAFVDPLTYFFDFGLVMSKLKRWYYKGQGDKCTLT